MISAFLINSLAAFKNNREEGKEGEKHVVTFGAGGVGVDGCSVGSPGGTRYTSASRELGWTGSSLKRELLPGEEAESVAVGIPCTEQPVRIGVISLAVPVPELGTGSAGSARAVGAMEGDRLSWDMSLTHPTGANPQVDGERGGTHHPLPPPMSWSCCEEQDHGFGREGAKWTPFLCQALLLPPDLAVALILSSPHTRVSRDVPHGQPRKQRFAWSPLSHWIRDITRMNSTESPPSCKPQISLDPTRQHITSRKGGSFLRRWLFQPIPVWEGSPDVLMIMAFTAGELLLRLFRLHLLSCCNWLPLVRLSVSHAAEDCLCST